MLSRWRACSWVSSGPLLAVELENGNAPKFRGRFDVRTVTFDVPILGRLLLRHLRLHIRDRIDRRAVTGILKIGVLANCEYPNGLALAPDERTIYVANTRSSQYIHAIRLDADGNMLGRSIFADLNEGSEPGIPDGLKVDSIGRVYCTGPGGIWVMEPDGRRIGVIRWPEQAVNFAFGGPDLRTLFCCAHTSVYTLRVKVPGNSHPWYKRRGQ